MSFPRYPKYKDSEVEWLGEVPEGWEITPCRAIVDEQTAKNKDGANQDYLSLMANVGVIAYEEKGDVGNKKPDDLSKCKLVSVGDFVIKQHELRYWVLWFESPEWGLQPRLYCAQAQT